MKGYRLTEEADRHLQEIWRYSRDRWNTEQADKYLAAIEVALNAAVTMPALLRPRLELGERIVARRTGSHVAYGIIENDELVVLAVLHARMDPKRHLLKQ